MIIERLSINRVPSTVVEPLCYLSCIPLDSCVCTESITMQRYKVF
jgi:hypothetical protein